MQEKAADAKYEISRAVKADLAAITRIYNASVLERNATAALHPVDIEDAKRGLTRMRRQIARYTCYASFARKI